MSHFNHAFHKVFIGTAGYHNTSNESTTDLETLEFGLYDAKTYKTYTTGSASPFLLASGSIYAEDKIGPFHGGYTTSNKSKLINPKFISKFYKVENKVSTQSVTIIGKTDNSATSACAYPTFVCGKTFRLRIDIKGSPALRFLNHQIYNTLDAYTGCCSDPENPTNVDPVTVMVQWAKQIAEHPYLSQFVSPLVRYTLDHTAGSPTWVTLDSVAEFDGYTPATSNIEDIGVGLQLTGAFVSTTFGNCSFDPKDHFELEPIQIYMSYVDDTNDPCVFESVCATQVTRGKQGEGYGETVIRELILSESYAQNYFNCDPRIREITQGNAIYDAVDRNAKYDVYYIQHNVPRYNNPSSTFDNDQYLLKIVTVPNVETTAAANNSGDATIVVSSFTGIAAGMRLYVNGTLSSNTVSATPTSTTVTMSGTQAVTAGDVLTFQDAGLYAFETVVAAALTAANNPVTLEVF